MYSMGCMCVCNEVCVICWVSDVHLCVNNPNRDGLFVCHVEHRGERRRLRRPENGDFGEV